MTKSGSLSSSSAEVSPKAYYFLTVSPSSENVAKKSFRQRLFSRSKDRRVVSENDANEASICVQPMVLPNGDKDFFASLDSPPSNLSTSAISTTTANTRSIADTKPTFRGLKTANDANVLSFDKLDDTDFLSAVLRYQESEPSTQAASNAIMISKVFSSQRSEEQDRLCLSPQPAVVYERLRSPERSNETAFRRKYPRNYSKIDSDSEDEYGSEESVHLSPSRQTAAHETQSQKSFSTSTDMLAATSALLTCTLLKTHCHLASIVAEDSGARARIPILQEEDSWVWKTEMLKFPRSRNRPTTLQQHTSLYGHNRNLGVALARSLIMRKLRQTQLASDHTKALSYFTKRYGVDPIASIHVKQAIQKLQQAKAEALVKLPFVPAAGESAASLAKLDRPGFQDRKECISSDGDTHSIAAVCLVQRPSSGPTSQIAAPRRAAPWLAAPERVAPNLAKPRSASDLRTAVQNAQSGSESTDTVDRSRQIPTKRHPVLTYHDRGGRKEISTNDRAARPKAEVVPVAVNGRAIQEARDRRNVNRQTMLLAEPNYGAGSPLVSKPVPTKESALNIIDARSTKGLARSLDVTQARQATTRRTSQRMYLLPEQQRSHSSIQPNLRTYTNSRGPMGYPTQYLGAPVPLIYSMPQLPGSTPMLPETCMFDGTRQRVASMYQQVTPMYATPVAPADWRTDHDRVGTSPSLRYPSHAIPFGIVPSMHWQLRSQ